MHEDVRLGGIVWVFLMGVVVLAALLAVYVLADGIRRALSPVAPSPRLLVTHTALQGVFLLLLLLAQFRLLTPWLPASAALFVPVALAGAVTYLLTVVFPRPQELTIAEKDETGCRSDDEERFTL